MKKPTVDALKADVDAKNKELRKAILSLDVKRAREALAARDRAERRFKRRSKSEA